MIEAENKNRWSIDIDLHIPIPSIKIRIHGDEEKIENIPLHYNQAAEQTVEVQEERAEEAAGEAPASQTPPKAQTAASGLSDGQSAAAADKNSTASEGGKQ